LPDNKKNTIEAKNLSIAYSADSPLLESIDIKAFAGNLIALIGINGSGKSTLLKSLLNLHIPHQGSVFINGKNIKDYTLSDLAKTISYVSTEIITVQNLSVYNLVAMGRSPYTNWLGTISSADHDIVLNSLVKVGMENYKDKNIHEISDGERQRVLIARTLAQDTPIILLDEPTSFLDLPNKFEIIDLLHSLARDHNKTILFSTHDLNIALQESDVFWIIEKNKIREGCPEDLILSGEFSTIFKGSKLGFNKSDGIFAIEKIKKYQIGLSGIGNELFWTTKALERIGFNVVPIDKKLNVKIIDSEDKNTRWELSSSDNLSSYDNIQNLLIKLKSLK